MSQKFKNFLSSENIFNFKY